ncbi:hypothetical protein LpLQ80_02990 [Lactiplantibacillus plantarum]|uniref:hypothetical protein n=1 Tax=Lactiplantibacillus plantarum TaxID=1590 RepID=UPI000D58B8EB|nr:hypothetical protein [Lactiplantibacillus plantarum]AWI39527.1 hypothetical protein LpLQ80_02990 [Lactiplantibacillus plantarum]
MTKTLEFAYETPQEVKVGDDETTFTLVCKNEDLPVDLTTAKLITVKIGNRSGYLRGQLISIDSLAKLPTGQFNFSFDKDTLANFPTGNYCLEVWVTDAQGTSIYPSGNPLNFIVTTNIENSSGATITTIAFDDFVKTMNKAASTIAKGDKGDDGLSAYQVAVINGYHGSQTDWLASLKGDKGDTPDLSNYTTVTDLNNGLSTKVTDNKNGTISVNGTSILPANVNVIDRIDGKYTDMNDVLMGWHYLNGWADVSKLANWGLPQDLYYIHCFKSGYGVSTNIQIAYGVELNNTYMRTAFGTNWKTWKLLADDSKVLHLSTGDTASRPTGISTGYQYFDTSLNKPIWYTGKNWVDATGTTV